MRVLQFIGSFNQGGSEKQAVQLIKYLRKTDECRVFVATLRKEGSLLEELAEEQIWEFPISSFYSLHFLGQLRECARFLRNYGIQVVHTHDFYSNIFGIIAAKIAGVKVKVASKRETGGMRSAGQLRVEKLVFQIADAIVVNAEAVKDYLVGEGVNAKKIRLIYNGVDLGRFENIRVDRREICEALGLPTDERIKFVALTANFRHEVKNQAMLLRAAHLLKDSFPNLHFVFAGEGQLLEQAKRLAVELGVADRVHFVGKCSMIEHLLSISSVCVLTSFHEGFPNAILEYMAAGKPVVATDVGGVREAVIDGKTGFLVKSNDERALAECVAFLIKNLEISEDMGKLGRQLVAEKFSVQVQLENVLKLYEELLR